MVQGMMANKYMNLRTHYRLEQKLMMVADVNNIMSESSARGPTSNRSSSLRRGQEELPGRQLDSRYQLSQEHPQGGVRHQTCQFCLQGRALELENQQGELEKCERLLPTTWSQATCIPALLLRVHC